MVGTAMRLRTILFGIAILAVTFIGATFAMQVLWPAAENSRRPVLADVPPLPPVSRTSTIVAPTVITLSAIRDMLEATAPRDLNGKRDNPVSKLLSNAEIGWQVNRGPLGVFGKPDVLGVSTVLTGTLRATGQIATLGGRRPRRRAQRSPRTRGRTQRREAGGTHARSAHRHPRQCRGGLAAAAHAGLAARAQPDHAFLDRRRQHDHRRRAAERVERSTAAAGAAGQ